MWNISLLILWILLACAFAGYVVITRQRILRMNLHYLKLMDDMLENRPLSPSFSPKDTMENKVVACLTRVYVQIRKQSSLHAEEKKRLEELISDISHQVKTPITNLRLSSAALADDTLTPKNRHHFLEQSEQQLDQLSFLVNAMIEVSRMETGIITLKKQSGQLSELIATAINRIALAAAQKDIRLSVDLPDDLSIPYDRKWTAEALYNLLDNAVKYTPSCGSIVISVECFSFFTAIHVADTGRGIAEQHLSLIFGRFYREPSVHEIEGIGLGLYLAREIIRRQNGYLKVQSTLQQGSRFSIYLPNENITKL